MSKKAVILHSGGLDSTVCLLLALEKNIDVLSLGIDYGQQGRVELEYAMRQCSKLKVIRKVLSAEWDKPNLNIPTGRSIQHIRQGISSAFLPGRNAFFLALACAEAAGVGASEVWIGVNSIDYPGYPDCRPEFLDEFRKMIKVAIPGAAEIVAPLMYKSKPEIALEAHRLGIRPDDTWSCYRPITTHNGFKPCGCCDGCVLNKYAWEEMLK